MLEKGNIFSPMPSLQVLPDSTLHTFYDSLWMLQLALPSLVRVDFGVIAVYVQLAMIVCIQETAVGHCAGNRVRREAS